MAGGRAGGLAMTSRDDPARRAALLKRREDAAAHVGFGKGYIAAVELMRERAAEMFLDPLVDDSRACSLRALAASIERRQAEQAERECPEPGEIDTAWDVLVKGHAEAKAGSP